MAGLKETMQKAALTAVNAFGNIRVSTVYSSFGSATYNASAGTMSPAVTSVAGVLVISSKFSIREMDAGHVEPEDKKFLVPATGPISTVTPKPEDKIRDEDGAIWNVQEANVDPAQALWALHVRRA